jgi:hypothetical protein
VLLASFALVGDFMCALYPAAPFPCDITARFPLPIFASVSDSDN